MTLEHPDLPAFEPELRRLSELAFGAAARLFEEREVRPDKLATELDDPGLRTAVRHACHEAFEETQQSVGERLAQLEEQVRILEADIRRLNDVRADTTGPKLRLETLKSRSLVLRRLMDSILYHLLQMKPWLARRLMSQRQLRRIDPAVVRPALKNAAVRNAENPQRFALVADVTTIVDICDLVETDITGNGAEITLIELKDGNINLRLMEAMHDTDKSHFTALLNELGEKGVDQAKRILKQAGRLLNAQEVIQTDTGVDPCTGMQMRLSHEEIEFEGYAANLHALIERARRDSIALMTVDSCLQIICAVFRKPSHGGFASILHALYHVNHPGLECLLIKHPRDEEELDAIAKEPPPIDLAKNSMVSRQAWPAYLWKLDPDSIMDIVFGRIQIFVQLNIEAFRQLVHESGLQTAWVSRRESHLLKQKRMSNWIPGAPRGVTALRVVGSRQQLYFSGFFWRVFNDMARPRDLLQLIATYQGANLSDGAK